MADSNQITNFPPYTTTEPGYWNLEELMKRYGVKRDALHKRRKYLEIKSEKTDHRRRSLYNQEQVKHMDELHLYIKSNGTMAGFFVPKLNEPSLHVEETAIVALLEEETLPPPTEKTVVVPLIEGDQTKSSRRIDYYSITRSYLGFSLMLLVSAIVAVNGVSIISAIATFAGAIALLLNSLKKKVIHTKNQILS